MHTKGTRSFASKAGTSLLREPESIRLGRDSERLVELMEHEKRETVYLDQQMALLQEELNSIKRAKKKILSEDSSEDAQRNKCVILEKRIELEVIQLNETKARSQDLMNEVNSYRKDKTHYKRTLQNLKEDISKFSKETEERKQEYFNGVELEGKYKKQLQNLRSKSLLDKSQYSEKVSEFSMFIQEKIDLRKQIHKKIEDGILGQIKRHSDAVEISKIQTTLVQRWAEKVKEKKKVLDNYMKHLTILQETFDQIKMATGMNSVSEIVTSVIKSEEQNYEVYSYVNSLNTEIDHLQESLNKTLAKINIIESEPSVVHSPHHDLLEELKEKKQEKKKDYEEKLNEVQTLLPLMKKIWATCLNSPIPLPRPDVNWQEIDSIEYEQVAEFLGQIEDYIAYANVFMKNLESGYDDKRREKTPGNIKDLEIKDFFNDTDFEDSKHPLSIQEFKLRTLSLLAEPTQNK